MATGHGMISKLPEDISIFLGWMTRRLQGSFPFLTELLQRFQRWWFLCTIFLLCLARDSEVILLVSISCILYYFLCYVTHISRISYVVVAERSQSAFFWRSSQPNDAHGPELTFHLPGTAATCWMMSSSVVFLAAVCCKSLLAVWNVA